MPCLPLAASSKNNNNKNIPTAQNFADKGEHTVLYKIKCVCVCVCVCVCARVCVGTNQNPVGFQSLLVEIKTGISPRRNQNCNLYR